MRAPWALVCAWALVSTLAFGEAAVEDCKRRLADEARRGGTVSQSGDEVPLPPAPPVVLRRPEEIEKLTVVAYNMLNLGSHVGKFAWDPATGTFTKIKAGQSKQARFREEQAAILAEIGADAVIAPEVEGLSALEQFVAHDAGHAYHPILQTGNDGRGIDIGMMLRRDLPLRWEIRSNKHVAFHDPVTNQRMKLFSRDIPVMILRLGDDPRPLLVLVGTHFKSKRDRPGDRESRILRKAQVDGAVSIVDELFREFGSDAPIVFGGDFNGSIHAEAEFASLKKALALADAFDLMTPPMTDAERITHTYHPQRGPVSKAQLDALFVSRGIQHCLEKAYVYRYRDASGHVKPIPNTIGQRKDNPSDHFPVVTEFDFQCLREALAQRSR